MMPLPYRFLTSMAARYNGMTILVDCGEGTQIALRKKGWSPNDIDIMCFTHFHADHISGLVGMLLAMGNAEKYSPLTIIGPKGIDKVVNSLRIIAPVLPFQIGFYEIEGDADEFPFDGFTIKAFKVQHNMPCFGYSLEVKRAPKFEVEKAKENNVPLKAWSTLQKGLDVEIDGVKYTPDQVLGSARTGLKVVYCTDTRPTQSIIDNGQDADLLILEGMYGEEEKIEKAIEHKHMTIYEACELAKKCNPKELWLTHYSPSLIHPEEYRDKACEIFERTIIAKDLRSVELNFED